MQGLNLVDVGMVLHVVRNLAVKSFGRLGRRPGAEAPLQESKAVPAAVLFRVTNLQPQLLRALLARSHSRPGCSKKPVEVVEMTMKVAVVDPQAASQLMTPLFLVAKSMH
jgi:hypothetical protein